MLTPAQEEHISRLCRLREQLSRKAIAETFGVKVSTVTAIYKRTLRLPRKYKHEDATREV